MTRADYENYMTVDDSLEEETMSLLEWYSEYVEFIPNVREYEFSYIKQDLIFYTRIFNGGELRHQVLDLDLLFSYKSSKGSPKNLQGEFDFQE